MQSNATPIIRDLVLLGGGHSHVEVVKKFGMAPLPGVRITLVARDLHTPYSGMLPGLVAGIYDFDETHVDLRPLCQFAGARLVHDEAIGLDTENQQIQFAARPPIAYDVLSINIGSRQPTHVVPGATQFATAVKPINRFMAAWEDIIERVLAYPGRRRIGVVGAGAAGVEIILSMQRRLRALLVDKERDPDELSFHLISKSSRILPNFNPGVSKRFDRILASRQVEVIAGSEVIEAGSDRIVLKSGEAIELDEILWVTEGGSQAWLGDAGLAVTEKGFVQVHETLQSVSHENIFAAGDIAHVVAHPRPKAGVIAVRQGPPLAENLRRRLRGEPLRTFRPQKNMLALIGTGDRHAIASRGSWHTEGRWVWRWKDWIDRRWMQKYHQLPDMSVADESLVALNPDDEDETALLANHTMRCMGCGGKVPPDILSKVLRDLNPVVRQEVVTGIDGPDDAALVKVPGEGLSVHTVDHLSAIVNDPYLFGKIAATHALSDIFAMGAEPQTALATLSVPHTSAAKVEASVRELMTGAIEVLNAANTSLIGGHTAEGAELSLGFAINGHVRPEQVLRKHGLETGDVLLLTKPLGVGVLFAADMRYQAKGRWIEAATEMMLQSNQAAAQILHQHHVHACTDVTGFGLLGHLLEMCADDTRVELDLENLPCLPGAVELTAQNIVSSLYEPNKRHFEPHLHRASIGAADKYDLLFDPQTSGGLLAAVPLAEAESCLTELWRAGYEHAMKIGWVGEAAAGGASVTVISVASAESQRING